MIKARIEFDRETCIGCGACTTTCDNWELEENEPKARPKVRELEEVGNNKDAAEICPVNCIKVVEQ